MRWDVWQGSGSLKNNVGSDFFGGAAFSTKSFDK
jgi:hypothetical protein